MIQTAHSCPLENSRDKVSHHVCLHRIYERQLLKPENPKTSILIHPLSLIGKINFWEPLDLPHFLLKSTSPAIYTSIYMSKTYAMHLHRKKRSTGTSKVYSLFIKSIRQRISWIRKRRIKRMNGWEPRWKWWKCW